MAEAAPPILHNSGERLTRPDIFIMWLDQYIGQEDQYMMLKNSFFFAMDPTSGIYERLNIDDIGRSIQSATGFFIRLDQVEVMFQAFDNVEKCFETIEKNLDKHIFLITSGTKGKILIPSLVINFPKIFKEEHWMYVFCGNMNMIKVGDVEPAHTWSLNFLDRVLMFDHQDDLLARLVLDIARYFSKKASELESARQLENASQYYGWSKKMYQRYGSLVNRGMIKELNQVDQNLNDIQKQLRQLHSDEEEENYGEATS